MDSSTFKVEPANKGYDGYESIENYSDTSVSLSCPIYFSHAEFQGVPILSALGLGSERFSF